MPLADISTGQVIKEVQKQPIIWKGRVGKTKGERTAAWEAVFVALVPEFMSLVAIERRELGKAIQQRWKTSRDAYIRCKSLLKSGSTSKKYFYYDRLKFLDTVLDGREADDEESTVTEVPLSSPIQQFDNELSHDDPLDSADTYTRNIKKEYTYNFFEDQQDSEDIVNSPSESEFQEEIPMKKRKMINKMESQKDMNMPGLENDNMAFFISMLPIVDKFTDQQKMLFRSEVIKVAMAISK